MPRTITAKLNAYVSEHCSLTPENFATADADRIAGAVSYWRQDMTPPSSYSLVGVAYVTITLADPDDLIAKKVEALRAEKQQTLADAQAKATNLERQIQQLLAITNGVRA